MVYGICCGRGGSRPVKDTLQRSQKHFDDEKGFRHEDGETHPQQFREIGIVFEFEFDIDFPPTPSPEIWILLPHTEGGCFDFQQP